MSHKTTKSNCLLPAQNHWLVNDECIKISAKTSVILVEVSVHQFGLVLACKVVVMRWKLCVAFSIEGAEGIAALILPTFYQ